MGVVGIANPDYYKRYRHISKLTTHQIRNELKTPLDRSTRSIVGGKVSVDGVLDTAGGASRKSLMINNFVPSGKKINLPIKQSKEEDYGPGAKGGLKKL